MASGPYPDERRGTWSVQWWDGAKWRRPTVTKKRPGWKRGDPMPVKPPLEAIQALAEYSEKERLARSREGTQHGTLIEDFLRNYADDYARVREPGSLRALLQVTPIFLEWCKREKVVFVSDLTKKKCAEWVDDRSRGIAPQTGKAILRSTLVKDRALVAAAWARAVERDMLDSNPWVGVKVPGKPAKKKRGSWTPDEFGRLIAASKPWLRDILTVGCHTGLRIEALIGLKWIHVAWAQPGSDGFGKLVIPPELDKTHKGFEVPLHQRAHDTMMNIIATNRQHPEFVLTGEKGQPIKCRDHTQTAITRAAKRAGIDHLVSTNHHMRRTFGRWAVAGHLTGYPVPVYIVSKWLAHASIAMTEHYLDLEEKDSTQWMLGKNPGVSGPSPTPPSATPDA